MNSLWQPRFEHSGSVTCALLVSVVAMHAPQAVAGSLDKEFYANGVAENAPINAGGRVQTWAGSDLVEDDVTIKAGVGANAVTRHFVHAPSITSGPKTFPPGVPIGATGSTVAAGYTSPPTITTDGAAHTAADTATASVTVDPQVVGGVVKVRLPTPRGQPPQFATFVLSNSVHGDVQTTTIAGVPTDGDKYHSADSFAGAEITATKTFVKTGTDAGIPVVQALGRNTVALGGSSAVDRSNNASEGGRLRDPYFLTVNDLTAGTTTRSVFMTEDIDYTNASIVMDDTGMHLTVRLADPTSVATIAFSTELPGVVNPYSYSVRLDDTGLSLGGSTSLGDWTVTSTATTMSADLAFGAGGMPFDEADVKPGSLTDGHTYSYDVGEGGGLSEFASAPVPEPASAATLLSGLALVGWLATRRRSRPQRS